MKWLCVETEENNLAWYYYVRNSKERLMKVLRKTKIRNCTVEKLRKRMNSNSNNSTPNRHRIEVAIVTTPGFTLIVCLDIYRFNRWMVNFVLSRGRETNYPLYSPTYSPCWPGVLPLGQADDISIRLDSFLLDRSLSCQIFVVSGWKI